MEDISDFIAKLLAVENSLNFHQEVEVEARVKKQLINEMSVRRLLQDKRFNWVQSTYTDRKRSSKSNRKCTYRNRCIGFCPLSGSSPEPAPSDFVLGGRQDQKGGTRGEGKPESRSEVICKSSLMKVDVNDMWCSLYVSTERPIPSMSQDLEDLETVSVVRHRAVFGEFFVDVTFSQLSPRILGGLPLRTGEDKAERAREDARVEIEAKDARFFNYESMIEVVSNVCHALQDSPRLVGYYDWKVATHVIKADYGPFCIDKGRYQKPNTITFRDLLTCTESDWAVTPKVDGVRRFLMIINGRTFDTDIAGNIRLMSMQIERDTDVIIVDTEFFDGVYYAFDIVVYDGKYYGDVPERFELLDLLVLELPDVETKPYEKFESFDELEKLHEKFRANYTLDGIVFARCTSYMQPVFKWKAYPTVDLRICKNSEDFYEVVTSDDVVVDLPWNKPREYSDKVSIWEFGYRSGVLTPIKPRCDKLVANSMKIVSKTIKSAVPGSLFTGVGCYLMRKYHNRVKASAIVKANDDKATVLDVGTGQGGDITKWKRTSKVYCVEPSVEATEEMKSRLRHNEAEKVTVFNVLLRDINIDLIPDKIDIFTAFFCVNLFQQGDWDMLKKVIEKKGSKKCRLLMIALTDPREHNNKCFTLRMLDTSRYNLQIHETRISDVTETKVDHKNLKEIMSESRMEMVVQQRLNEESFMTSKERTLSSMYTLFVFKKK